jgi:UDP-glucuronate 4-epimerase
VKRVLVTGVAGFIGSNLAKELLVSEHEVIGIDNFDSFYDIKVKLDNIKPLAEHEKFHLFEGDIRNKEFMSKVFESTKPDCVVHLAARAGVRPSIDDPELYFDVNINGTITLLNTMKDNGVKDLVFASSSSVYGNNSKTPFAETDNVDNPISPYAASKKAGELLCFTYHHLYKMNIFCLRFFTVYGHNQRPEMAIQQFGRLIRQGRPVTMYGDGNTRRDYTFIDDIVAGIIASIDKVNGYEVINLGNNQTVRLSDLINEIGTVLALPVKIEQKPIQPGDVEITYADISKAKELLGYYPKHSIKEGLFKMFITDLKH